MNFKKDRAGAKNLKVVRGPQVLQLLFEVLSVGLPRHAGSPYARRGVLWDAFRRHFIATMKKVQIEMGGKNPAPTIGRLYPGLRNPY
jgi:hypothetical protein